MTTEDISLALEERTVIRKGLKQLQKDGKVPAVIHDHGKESIHVMADFVPISKVFALAGKHHPVQLTVGNTKHLAMIKDADVEPVKHRLRHVVFQAIKQNETVTAEVPVVLTGEIPAEKVSLLVLTQTTVVEIEALPRALPDQLEVDASTLAAVGDRLTVADIKVPEGVTIMTDPEQVLAMVEMPKDQIAEADAAAESLAADAVAHGETAEEAAEEPKAEAETTEEDKA